MDFPLSGIRILDLSRALPGPYCSQLLSDYGAEIIKIEDRDGDPSRKNLPRLAGEGAQFYSVNRNKRSLTLDLKQKKGQEIFRKLVRVSDVVIDGFRPGTMDKFGLGYEALKQLNPSLIYCALTAYGWTGPLRNAPSHDINISSLAGITELTGHHNGPPAMSTVQISAVSGALYSAIAILVALHHRDKTGEGQFCDVAMLDSAVNLLAYTMAEWSGNQSLPRRGKGRLTGAFAYFNIYETSDGRYISVGASEEKYWTRFCTVINKPEYIKPHKEPSMQEEMINGIQDRIKRKSQSEWLEIFGDEACITPVLSLDEVSEHPQVKDRRTIIKIGNFRETGIDLALPGPVIKFSNSSNQPKYEFPRLGQHSGKILEELGYTLDEIEVLVKEKII